MDFSLYHRFQEFKDRFDMAKSEEARKAIVDELKSAVQQQPSLADLATEVKASGLYLHSVTKEDHLFIEDIGNKTFHVTYIDGKKWMIEGDPAVCATPVEAIITGSGWGWSGSGIKTNFIGYGLRMEYILNKVTFTTRDIKKIEHYVAAREEFITISA